MDVTRGTSDLLGYHRSMLHDRTRVDAYRAAIAKTVRPGDVVCDLGTGTGLLALLALQAGAARVHAIEVGAAADIARRVALANGWADRFILHVGESTHVDLPEKADVLVSEIIGHLGFDEGILGYVEDARARMLRPDARIVPSALELWVAPLEDAEFHGDNIRVWKEKVADIDVRPLLSFAVSTLHPRRVRKRSLLGRGVRVHRAEFAASPPPSFTARARLSVDREGTLHGLAGWFVAELAEGVTLTNAPPNRARSWHHGVMAIDPAVPVRAGDRVDASISSHDGATWRWQGRVRHGNGSVRFDHNSALGIVPELEVFRSAPPSFVPKLARRGEAQKALLEAIDGRRSIADLTRDLYARFGDLFRSPRACEDFVRMLAHDAERASP